MRCSSRLDPTSTFFWNSTNFVVMSFFFGRWCQETPGCGLSFFAKVAHTASTRCSHQPATAATHTQAYSNPNVPMAIKNISMRDKYHHHHAMRVYLPTKVFSGIWVESAPPYAPLYLFENPKRHTLISSHRTIIFYSHDEA